MAVKHPLPSEGLTLQIETQYLQILTPLGLGGPHFSPIWQLPTHSKLAQRCSRQPRSAKESSYGSRVRVLGSFTPVFVDRICVWGVGVDLAPALLWQHGAYRALWRAFWGSCRRGCGHPSPMHPWGGGAQKVELGPAPLSSSGGSQSREGGDWNWW